MVFIEGLISKEKAKHYKDCGYDIIKTYHTKEEAKAAEPDVFDDDCGIGEDDQVWIKVYLDCNITDVLDCKF